MSYFNSPAQTLFLELSRAQGDLNQKRQEEWATPEMAAALAQYSTTLPQGSSALGLALAQGGIPAGDQLAQDLVMQEMALREDNLGPIEKPGEGFWDDLSGVWSEAVWEPLKGTSRWTMSAWDAAYNMVAGGAPIRALMLSKQEDISFKEAWLEQDPYFFEALGGVIAGEHVNLSSGFLPDSDVAPDVEQYVNAEMMKVEQQNQGLSTNEEYTANLLAAPEVWNKAVTQSAEQAALGKPLTELARVNNQAVMFAVPRLGGGTSYTPWSPGRIGASTVWEPGSQGFKYASGTGDFLAQMFADPIDYIGLGWAKAGRAGRLLKSETTRAAEEVLTGFGGTGKLDGTRAAARQLSIKGSNDYLPVSARADWHQQQLQESAQLALPAESAAAPLGVANRQGRMGITTGKGERIPWWRSPQAEAEPLTAFDPPRWHVDAADAQRNSARGKYAATAKVKGKKTSRHWTKVQAGDYTLELPRIAGQKQTYVRIRRVKKDGRTYWDVQTPEGKMHGRKADPRFSEVGKDVGYDNLNDAKKAANSYAYGSPERMKVYGMTPDDFENSGEAFYIQDGINWLAEQGRVGPSKSEGMNNLRKVNRSKPFDDNNMKIVVFGRSLDLADRKVAGKPQGLLDALKRDRKLRGDNISGNPSVDSFTHTRKWMEENGYGKLDMGNDDILIADKYIGGDPADAHQRFFTERPSEPMRTLDLGGGVEPVMSTSADEVNSVIEWFARTGKEIPNELDVELAEQIRAVRRAETPSPDLSGVRVDYDDKATWDTMKGKKADMFVARLMSTTKRGGQTNRAAMDKLLRFLRKGNVDIPTEYRKALFEAQSETAVRGIFARMMTEELGGEMLLPGGQYGRIATTAYKARGGPDFSPLRPLGVRWTDKPFFARRSAMMLPSKDVNLIEDPAKAYGTLEDILQNYNVQRGAVYTLDDGTVVDVEKVMDSLLDLKPGDEELAMNAMRDYSQVLFAGLKSQGVGDALATHATRYFEDLNDIRSFNTARLGQGNIKNGAVDMPVVNDLLVGGLDGPQITSQAWNGVITFPDQHTVKVIANESDALGRISNMLTNKWGVNEAGMMKVERRAWNLYATNLMNRMWKPFVLLRGAWTLRILIDDQLRIAADGYTSMFQHPIRLINYALTQPDNFEVALKKGLYDVFGEKMTLDNISALQHGDLLRKAAMSKGDPKIGPGSRGYKHRTAVPKGDARYVTGQATEIRMLRNDQITSALAGADAEDATEVVTQMLMGNVKKADEASWLEARTSLATFNNRMPDDVQKLIMEGDHDTIYMLVSHQDAMLRQTLGGRVVYDDGAGKVFDYSQFKPVTDVRSTGNGIPQWRVIDNGDKDLLDIVARRTSAVGDLATDESMAGLQKMLKGKLDENPDVYPNMQMVSDASRTGGNTRGEYDKAVDMFYEWAMTRPSDAFSRVPLFRQAYWRKMGHLHPNYSPKVQKTMESRAKAAGALDELKKGMKETGKGTEAVKLTDLNAADEYAKAYGLTEVQRTLFDLVNKRNISDSLTLIFPFVEAWGEFITRWGRMMVTGDRNVVNMRRFQKGVEGLRDDSGFFHDNEFGQEVFTYPAFLKKGHIAVHNTLNNIPLVGSAMGGDIDAATAENMQLQGNAEGLNFASGIIPGFGPVFQQLAKAIPDDPGFDFIRDIVAPYGTEGTISQVMPAWLKRIVSAHGGASDPTLQYTWTSTVQDVMRTMMDEGEFAGVTSNEEIDELLKKAEDKARGILMVRAAATWWTPTSPSLRWTKEDKNGEVWSYSNLGEEYRKIQDELGGSETAAFDEFYRRFGFLPAPFTRGRTYSVVDRSRTKEGSAFERASSSLFAKYPLSAMYLDPHIGAEGEYDHATTLQQLKESEREQWTPEQMVYLQQDQYGDLMWDNAQLMGQYQQKGAARNAFLATAREEIGTLYPYWNKAIPGKRQGASNEEQMAEVVAWTRDEQLIGTPVVAAVRQYLKQRDEVLGIIQQAGATTIKGPKGETQAGRVATLGREWLRDEAERLSQSYPEFDPVFQSVFAYEVSEDHDALPEVGVEASDAWGEGDILEAVLGVTSDGR